MKRWFLIMACVMVLIGLLTSYRTVLAHEQITVGNYEIVVGWVSEPPVVGQLNGVEIRVSDGSTGEEQPVADISGLIVTVSYGGQSKELALEPLGADSPGQFEAPILPTIPGQYTITFGGRLGDTAIEAHVEPEEVAAADAIQFPSLDATAQSPDFGIINWLLYFNMLIGLIALILAVMALRKTG